MIKAVLTDFDGTLVTQDVLDVLCEMVGKREVSERLNREFQEGKISGRESLIKRINFLRGVSGAQIKGKLEENLYLRKGAKELFDFLKQKGIVSVLYSGNIVPVLDFYQNLLGITYVVGAAPKMEGETILGIGEEDFPEGNFKVEGVRKILAQLSIDPKDTIAMGDSPADKPIFEFAGKSIAIDPKNGIEKFADYVVNEDLTEIVEILRKNYGLT